MIELSTRRQPFVELSFPEGETIDRIGSVLRAMPGICAESESNYACTLYDSFDGRIYNERLMLLWADFESGAELQLLSRDDTTLLWRQPFAEPPDTFNFEINEPDVSAWLERTMGLRALLRAVNLAVHRQTFRWTDDEGKTHARLQMEEVFIESNDNPARVGARLVIEPLRGYENSALRLKDRIARDSGVEIDTQGLCARLMARHSAEFARRSARFNVSLSPEMRADAALIKVLTFLMDVMEINEQGLIEGHDTEFLHDFRIAIRRTRVLFSQCRDLFPPREFKRFRKEFAWLGQVTGLSRDLDVYLLIIPEFQALLPKNLREYLTPVRDLLRKQRGTEQKKLTTALRSKRYRRFKVKWREFLEQPLPAYAPEAGSAALVMTMAQESIHSLFKQVLREGSAIDNDAPAEDLHELRKSCKKLRYLIECFQSLFPADQIGTIIRALKRLQVNLGEFQDLDVQIIGLEGIADQLDMSQKEIAYTLLAMGAVLGRLQDRKLVVRKESKSRFAAFSAKRNRHRFKRLFRTGKHRHRT